MPRSVLLLLCLHVAVCGVLTTVLNSTRSDVTDDAGSNNLHFSPGRLRRAIPKKIGTILKSAWMTFSTSDYKLYKKIGGYRDALRDFHKLNPTDIIQDGVRTTGTVGDAFVEVHKQERRRQKHTKSDLVISSRKGGKVEKVIILYIPKH